MSAREASPSSAAPTSMIDTIQSLIVSFVFAMIFRGFIVEGYVIPTGSMAPTLMGSHVRLRSAATGYEFAADNQEVVMTAMAGMRGDRPIFDPMISHQQPIAAMPNDVLARDGRLGDRVMVVKYLKPFTAPQRWDVAVFKNPTDPVGDSVYYIKRVVGLPNESFAVVDGDIYTGPIDADPEQLRIERKPEHVQRAVWQPVHDSDFEPVDVPRLESAMKRPWQGVPWTASTGWNIRAERAWEWKSSAPASLTWSNQIIAIDDWNAYNCYRREMPLFPMSDVCIASAIETTDGDSFQSRLVIRTRGLEIAFALARGEAVLSVTESESRREVARQAVPCRLASDRTHWVEMWHVDEQLTFWLDGAAVAVLPYTIGGPRARTEASHFGRTAEQVIANPIAQRPPPTQLEWTFQGSSFVLRRVQVKRDLYYRPDFLSAANQFPTNGEPLVGLSYGANPLKPAQTGSETYVMFGDNSAASKDSRVWGLPHPLVTEELGVSSPFVVPREMVIGKAWSVYFPAPIALSPGGRAFIPDFGRVRFIR